VGELNTLVTGNTTQGQHVAQAASQASKTEASGGRIHNMLHKDEAQSHKKALPTKAAGGSSEDIIPFDDDGDMKDF
jgi:hypothetical protein